MQREVIIVGNARCFHTMDWFRTVEKISSGRWKVSFVTDLKDSEGYTVLVRETDDVYDLFNIDWLLFRSQSNIGNIWRNAVKLILSPIQAYRLNKFAKNHPGAVYHAHTMYYIFVCRLAGVQCIGTPQGSEILVRPNKSLAYRAFAASALKWASVVTVDSPKMRDEMSRLFGVVPLIIQNGVETGTLLALANHSSRRDLVVSVRGMAELYRIDKIIEARDRSASNCPLTLIYPLWEDGFLKRVRAMLGSYDRDLGRLSKDEMFALLARSKLVLSIPASDSSPRSVYESIFAGSCVAATYASWLDPLPACMRERVFVVDLDDPSWFEKAISFADRQRHIAYQPSEEALAAYDQDRQVMTLISDIYDR